MSSSTTLLAYLDSAVKIAYEAGALISEAYCHVAPSSSPPGESSSKVYVKDGNAVDLVTETDRRCEKLIFERLRKDWADCLFIGEETTAGEGKSELTDAPTWIVDPIDGTTNFVHGNPFTCVSIGLSIDREPVVGVVYNPITDQLYSAAKAHGAFLNKQTALPLSGRPVPSSLSGALLATEYGSDRTPKVLKSKVDTMARFVAAESDGGAGCHGVRMFGTAAMDMCEVARGGVDLYWEIGLHCWDFAAATVIVRESGGRVITCEGKWDSKRPAASAVEVGPVDELDLLSRKVICVRQGSGANMAKLLSEGLGFIEDIPMPRD